ncbi:MAG TPA: SRPBCC domain-containing protein [Candidatus Stackebrandtia excrementipullorum]|nr:SRPBCC domain-containing protein [Candidatus Stackebrandtia excrementipullorum]
MAEVTRVVNAPVDRVFAVLEDGWSYSDWVVGTAHIKGVEADWPQEGSNLWVRTGIWPFDVPGHTLSLECDPPTRLVLRPTLWPAGELTVTLQLSEISDTKTRLTLEEHPKAGPLQGMRVKLNDLVLHKRNVESVRRLADIAERRRSD